VPPNTWRTRAQTLCFCPVKIYCNVDWGLLTLSWVGKATAEVNLQTPLEQQFQCGVMNFTVKRTKAVWTPKDKGKPATKFDFKPHSDYPLLISRACPAKLHTYSLVAFIVFTLNICTIVIVAFILQQKEKAKFSDETSL
jgi:hypothetical protein